MFICETLTHKDGKGIVFSFITSHCVVLASAKTNKNLTFTYEFRVKIDCRSSRGKVMSRNAHPNWFYTQYDSQNNDSIRTRIGYRWISAITSKSEPGPTGIKNFTRIRADLSRWKSQLRITLYLRW